MQTNNQIQIPPAVYLGSSLEEKPLTYDLNESGQAQIKLKPSEVGHKAATSAASQVHPSLIVTSRDTVGGCGSGTTATEAPKASEQNIAVEECGEQMKHLTKYKSNKMLLEC